MSYQINHKYALFTCKYDQCGRHFSSKYHLKCHKLKIHKQTTPQHEPLDYSNKTSNKNNNKEIYQCDICGIVCSNKKILWEHIRKHTKAKKYTCINCNNKYPTEKYLNQHKQICKYNISNINTEYESKNTIQPDIYLIEQNTKTDNRWSKNPYTLTEQQTKEQSPKQQFLYINDNNITVTHINDQHQKDTPAEFQYTSPNNATDHETHIHPNLQIIEKFNCINCNSDLPVYKKLKNHILSSFLGCRICYDRDNKTMNKETYDMSTQTLHPGTSQELESISTHQEQTDKP